MPPHPVGDAHPSRRYSRLTWAKGRAIFDDVESLRSGERIMRALVITVGIILLTVSSSMTHETLASDYFDPLEKLEKLRLDEHERANQEATDQTIPERLEDDVPPNHPMESGNTLRAAYNGDVSAQEALGQAHLHGVGAPKNSIRAHMWFSLAAAQGSDTSARERDSLTDSMSKGQITSAQQLSTELWERMSLADVMGWSHDWWIIYATKLVLQR